jgi:hypothetical protein
MILHPRETIGSRQSTTSETAISGQEVANIAYLLRVCFVGLVVEFPVNPLQPFIDSGHPM